MTRNEKLYNEIENLAEQYTIHGILRELEAVCDAKQKEDDYTGINANDKKIKRHYRTMAGRIEKLAQDAYERKV